VALAVSTFPFRDQHVTFTVVRPASTDKYGDPVGDPTEHDIPGCLAAPGNTTEATTTGDTVLADVTLYAPAGADITASDKGRIGSVPYEVIGRPRVWLDRGVEVPLRQVTG
jgi:hypothetical protein